MANGYVDPGTGSVYGGTPVAYNPPQQKQPTPVAYPNETQEGWPGQGPNMPPGDWMAKMRKMQMAAAAAKAQQAVQQGGGTPTNLGITGKTGPVLGPPTPPGYRFPGTAATPNLAQQMNTLNNSNINGPTTGGYQYPPTIGPRTGYQRPPNVNPQVQPNENQTAYNNAQPFIQSQERQAAFLKAAQAARDAAQALDASRNYSFREQDSARDYGNLMSHLPVKAPSVVNPQGTGGDGSGWGSWGYGGYGGYGAYGSYAGAAKSWFMNLLTLKLGI